MYFFIDPTVAQKNSGVEHAAFNRLKLFKDNGQKAKIVTRNYNRFLYKFLKDEGVPSDQSVSMFDFFQHTIDYERKAIRTDDLTIDNAYELDRQSKYTKVYDNDRLVMQINYIPGTFEEINTITHFDRFGNGVETDFYDWRGFKSMQQYYDVNGTTVKEQMLTPNGEVVYESYYAKDANGKQRNSLLKLVNYHGEDYYFNSLLELFTFFLDELNTYYGGNNTFMSDRRINDADTALLAMKTKCRKVAIIHSTASSDDDNQVDGKLNPVYADILENQPQQLDAIIVSTEHQRNDLSLRYPNLDKKLHQVPVGMVNVDELKEPKKLSEKPNRIIAVSRISDEKRPQDIIRALSLVIKKVPDATLEFRGYVNGDTGKKVLKLLDELKLKDKVIQRPYTTDKDRLNATYDGGKVEVLASTSEGFGQSILEGEEHGIPQVAYDINYGPNEMIDSGKNGYLVRSGDISGLADKIVAVLTDPNIDQMADASVNKAKTYSTEAIWQKWQVALGEGVSQV